MSLPSAVTIPAQVMSRQVGEETVLLDLASGNYYGLDPTGARIWRLLTEGKTPVEAHSALLLEYDVAADRLEQDMSHLLNELRAKGLLVVE